MEDGPLRDALKMNGKTQLILEKLRGDVIEANQRTIEVLQAMEKIWSEVRGGVPMTMPTVQHIRALQRIHGVAQAALYTNPPTPVNPKSEES